VGRIVLISSVTSTTSPPGALMSSVIAKWLVMACVSTAKRKVPNPAQHRGSAAPTFHTMTFHSTAMAWSCRR
jgi:hypothetical protein